MLFRSMLAWSSQVGYDLSDDAVAGMALRPATSAAASALVVKAEPGAGTFSLAAPRCLIASGPHMTPVVHPAGIVITFPSAAASTLMLVPLDKAPLATSEKLWLCAVSRSDNPDMVWNAARTSVGNQWGNGPTLTLGVNATVTLPEGTSWKVEALSSTGQPMATVAEKTRSFSLDPAQKTVWWLLTRQSK